jgi:hypothetical protein
MKVRITGYPPDLGYWYYHKVNQIFDVRSEDETYYEVLIEKSVYGYVPKSNCEPVNEIVIEGEYYLSGMGFPCIKSHPTATPLVLSNYLEPFKGKRVKITIEEL